MAQSQIRSYTVQARSTDTFGRVLCSARDQHFVVDGPVQNGCPGEAVNPGEIIVRQRGTAIMAGKNIGTGNDHTLFALTKGTVRFRAKRKTNYDGRSVTRRVVDVV